MIRNAYGRTIKVPNFRMQRPVHPEMVDFVVVNFTGLRAETLMRQRFPGRQSFRPSRKPVCRKSRVVGIDYTFKREFVYILASPYLILRREC